MFPPFCMKWLAKVWRSAWLACPFGSSMPDRLSARWNQVIALVLLEAADARDSSP